MRRVNVYEYQQEKGSMLRKKVIAGQAWFHGWGVGHEALESSAGNFTTAIIERDDGTVETPAANMIGFVEPWSDENGVF